MSRGYEVIVVRKGSRYRRLGSSTLQEHEKCIRSWKPDSLGGQGKRDGGSVLAAEGRVKEE